MREAALDTTLAQLPKLSLAELRARWLAHFGPPVPKISAALLRSGFAWELQAKEHGGLSREATRRLEQLANGKTKTHVLRPGMRLVREWNDVLHVVKIGDEGQILWNDREWASLSQVAREITGTRWSGPAFFGLKKKVSS